MPDFVSAHEICRAQPEICEAANNVRESMDFLSLKRIKSEMPEPIDLSDSNDRVGQVAVIEPKAGFDEEAPAIVRFSEHQQGYSPMQFIGAKIMQQVVSPNSPLVMITADSFNFSQSDLEKLRSGDLDPLGSAGMKILEELGFDRVVLTGYSLGALAAAATAGKSSDIEVVHVNMDELPSKDGRSAQDLKTDFIASGTFSEQRKAMLEANLRSIDKLRARRRLGLGNARFGLDSFKDENKALVGAMSGSAREVVDEILESYPDADRKIGHIDGSEIFDTNSVSDDVRVVEYGGPGFHKHATVNNPFLAASLLAHGIRTSARNLEDDVQL